MTDRISLPCIQADLRSGHITMRALVQRYLDRVRDTQQLNAYVDVYEDEALRAADRIDARLKAEATDLGTLFGAVVSIKDVLSYKGHRLNAGSKILEGYKSQYTATAVQRLLDQDAIIIGRTNCDEFAMGSTNENSCFGPVYNAAGKDRVPGGSSGGAAVAAQTDTCLLSIGSDTGGSLRQPASFCGLIGLKPSYGRISRHGLVAYGSSLDQIGLIGRELTDIKLAYQAMRGPDAYDATLYRGEDPEADLSQGRFKLAYIKEALSLPGLQNEIRSSFEQLLGRLGRSSSKVETLDFPLLPYVIPCYYVIAAAEASSNLGRYDGIRYGFRSASAHELSELYVRSRTEGFGAEVKRRILLGTFVLSVGYYDAYFSKAQKVRRKINEQFESWLSDFDAIILPTAPSTAWSIGAQKSAVEIYLADVYAVLANLTGLPAISIPLGHDTEGLPFGLQIISGRFGEEKLLRVAESIMKETNLPLG